MTPDLEQLADETVDLRRTDIGAAINRLRTRAWDGTGVDHLQETRDRIASAWDQRWPRLARLAAERTAELTEAGAP